MTPEDYSAELPKPLIDGVDWAVAPCLTVSLFALVLSEQAGAILRLAAAHDDVSETDLVTRLVCQHAESIGLSALLGSVEELHDVPPFERAETRFRGKGGP